MLTIFNLHARVASKEILKGVNQWLHPDLKEGMFVTLQYLLINLSTKRMRLANAGHNPVIIYNSLTGAFNSIQPKGIALGIDKGPIFNANIQLFEYAIQPGDLLVFHTDGLSEASNARGEEYGEVRMLDAIKALGGDHADPFLERMLKDLEKFNGNQTQMDDITMIAIRLEAPTE